MKKIVYVLTGIALTVTLMVGCGAANTQSNNTASNASNDDGKSKQRNFQRADLEGEVASIDGNKVTLKVIKTPERPEGTGDKQPSKDGGNKTDKKANTQDKQVPNGSLNKQVEYTGETKDVTLGDGIQIKSMGRGTQAKDLTVNDIKVGDRLGITYSNKDNETISSIIVMPALNENAKTDDGN
ncbi:hypothetical protein CDLVIII_4164 [Clostridium sp. DL-VIII]|uniref:hypothetical protein n=1 Tax=Clostridium sp. DL-VIII TaxID=641107 RepID=UPI00023AFB56|nr:hypothetical protein [Clostridium sp. DL-VIII]EHJ00693.1 hypothetical protein CDLVIII_4164 [Clostridium sp. DL-VIII]